MGRFFTSDFHINHFNLTSNPKSKNYCNRPWDNIADMNHAIINRFNSVVTNEDTVYFLGDFTLDKLKAVEEWLPKFNRKEFIWVVGNHDRIFKKFNSQQLQERYLAAGVDEIHMYTEIELQGIKVALSHFPYKPPERLNEDTRYLDKRPENKGLPLICGHVHDVWKVGPYAKMVNVGVDSWNWYPVSEDQILEVFKENRWI